MDIGDLIMWALLMAGAYAITRNTWHLVQPRLLMLWRSSTISPPTPAEITSSRAGVAAHTSTDTSTISDNAAAPYPYLTERAIVVWLAGLKTADSWRYSANKIYALVGGNRNDVMTWVRSVRGEEPAPPADDEVITPYAGRKTKAAYYPDDPLLEYQPPN